MPKTVWFEYGYSDEEWNRVEEISSDTPCRYTAEKDGNSFPIGRASLYLDIEVFLNNRWVVGQVLDPPSTETFEVQLNCLFRKDDIEKRVASALSSLGIPDGVCKVVSVKRVG